MCCSRVLHPSHDAPRSLFARAKPAPGDEAAYFVTCKEIQNVSYRALTLRQGESALAFNLDRVATVREKHFFKFREMSGNVAPSQGNFKSTSESVKSQGNFIFYFDKDFS